MDPITLGMLAFCGVIGYVGCKGGKDKDECRESGWLEKNKTYRCKYVAQTADSDIEGEVEIGPTSRGVGGSEVEKLIQDHVESKENSGVKGVWVYDIQES